MRNLIRGEWFRLRHSSHGLLLLATACLLVIPFFIMYDPDSMDMNLSEGIGALSNNLPLHIVMIGLVVSCLLGSSYQNKTAYYEVMDGGRISHIIWSKLLVYCTASCVMFTVLTAGCLWLLTAQNGVGEMEQPALVLALLFVIFLRGITNAILLVLCARSTVGVLLAFTRAQILELPLCIMGGTVAEEVALGHAGFLERLVYNTSRYFGMAQGEQLISSGVSGKLVITVLVSAMVEFILWYGIAYLGFKLRKFK